jgi:hypothetical protein
MGLKHHPRVVTNGLVYYLDAANTRCYSGSGLTANALIGGIGGTLVNGTGYSSANSGSFFFDGTNDSLEFSSYTPDANTVNIWVNLKSLQNGPIIFVGDDTYNSGLWSWSFFAFSSLFYFRASTTSQYFTEVPQFNTWINYTLIRNDGSNVSIAYKNGVFFGSLPDSTTLNPYSNMRIGRSAGNFANFNLGQVQIYNRALTAQEVLQNYNATKMRYGL